MAANAVICISTKEQKLPVGNGKGIVRVVDTFEINGSGKTEKNTGQDNLSCGETMR